MSGKVSLDRILKSYSSMGLTEIDEIMGEWTFAIDDLPVKLKIKVVYTMPQGKYMGVANYRIQNPKQATPYISLYLCDTVEEALIDALKGFLTFWVPKQYKDTTRFEPVEDW